MAKCSNCGKKIRFHTSPQIDECVNHLAKVKALLRQMEKDFAAEDDEVEES